MTMTSRGDLTRQKIANSLRIGTRYTFPQMEPQVIQHLVEMQRMQAEIMEITSQQMEGRRYLCPPLPTPKVHEPFRDIGAERAALRQAEAKDIAARFDGRAVSNAMQRADHSTRDNWRPGYANLYLNTTDVLG